MKATIATKHHENSGQTFRVVEIHQNRIVCLDIGGRKVDFGMSEVEIVPDASAGKEILFAFTEYGDCALRDSHVLRIAKRAAAAWRQKINNCTKAVHLYLSGPA